MILSGCPDGDGGAELAFEHIFELQARPWTDESELAERTDYESEEYHQLIDRFTHENDRFLMMGGTNFQAEMNDAVGIGLQPEDFNVFDFRIFRWLAYAYRTCKLLLVVRMCCSRWADQSSWYRGIQWLENFLSTRANAVVLVSHDRAFLIM